MEKHTDTGYCPFCDKETEHEFVNMQHERDSSHDKETCLECGAYRFGFTDSWKKDES